MSQDEELLRTDFDPNDRELCPDGACIGVIGADGRCGDCGKASLKKAPSAGRKGANKADDGVPVPTAALAVGKPKDGSAADDSNASGPRQVEGNDFDPERRELCPDGACIGVIGPDGRCAECGKPSADGPRTGGPTPPPARIDNDDDDGTDDSDDDEDGPSSSSVAAGGQGDPSEPAQFDERQLCPDGACIGLIGPDGKCRECGTPAE